MLIGVEFERVSHFYWLLRRINEEELHTDIELSPPSLIDLKWPLFYGLDWFWEGGMQLEDYLFDIVRNVLLIV